MTFPPTFFSNSSCSCRFQAIFFISCHYNTSYIIILSMLICHFTYFFLGGQPLFLSYFYYVFFFITHIHINFHNFFHLSVIFFSNSLMPNVLIFYLHYAHSKLTCPYEQNSEVCSIRSGLAVCLRKYLIGGSLVFHFPHITSFIHRMATHFRHLGNIVSLNRNHNNRIKEFYDALIDFTAI